MKTRVCDMFGIDLPIFAFSHCRDVVAAVSKAGGLGVLGALAFSPEQLEIELNWIDEHVDGKPYGVDHVRPQDQRRDVAGVAAGLATLGDDDVDALVHVAFCLLHAAAQRRDLHTVLVGEVDDVLGR